MIDLGPDTAVRQRPGVLCREIEGEAVLLDTQAGIYFGLNETGTRAWALIGAGAPLAAVCAGLLADYDVEEPRVWQDLLELIRGLARHGLVEILESAGPGEPGPAGT